MMTRIKFCAMGVLVLVVGGCYAVSKVPDDFLTIDEKVNPWEEAANAPANAAQPISAAPVVPIPTVAAPPPVAVVPPPPPLITSDRAPRLAVMDIDDRSNTVREKLLGDLTEYLRARLTATGRFLVIDRSRQAAQLHKIMKKEKSESYKDCYSKQCQIPLGQALSADSILRAKLSMIGGTYALSVEVVDLAKEATVSGAVAECPATPKKGLDQRLLDTVRRIVADLARR